MNFENLDFTIHKYRRACEAIVKHYSTITMAEYVEESKLPEKFVLMRHDVDRMPRNALKIAEIEQELGIRSTYYFRSNNNVFHPEIIKKIEDMGHEIGYHYEVLSEAKGNYEKAIKLFEYHLDKFTKICDVKTICMHGRPLSKYDNRDLWKVHDFRDFGIVGEAYLSAGKDLNYFSDTGRNWNSKNNLRDFIPGKKEYIAVDTTDDLIELIENDEIDNFYILTHPERWSANIPEWGLYYSVDFSFNFGKKVLMMVRKW